MNLNHYSLIKECSFCYLCF